jgi:TonB family protein
MQNLLLECAVRATLLAICTAAVLHVLRVRAARVRHGVWASVMVLMLALPVWTAWGPRAVARVLKPAATQTINRSTMPTETLAGLALHQPLRAETPKPQVQSVITWRNGLAAAYLLGFFALLARLAIGTVRAHMLVRRAASREGRLTSDSCAAPVTVGWLKPSVILPDSWRRWPQEQLNAVLTHEDEHARRRDPLVQWLALLNRAIFWFHPLAWWLERRLSALAEEACDAAVLARGHDPFQYSECLLEMARVVRQSGARVHAVGMAMPGTFLPQRVRRILEGGLGQRVSRVRMACVAAACMVVSTVFVAGAVDYKQPAIPPPAGKLRAVEPASPGPQQTRPTILLAQAQARPAAQNPPPPASGSVSGTVEDPSGARVPGCVITARNQSGAGVGAATADAAGFYRLPSLPPGQYKLEFAAAGFALKTVEAKIEPGKPVRIDAMLDLGQVSERLTVTGVSSGVTGGIPGGVSGGVPPRPVRFRVGGNVQPLRLVEKTMPVYPPELEKQGVEGTAVVRTVISRDGVPLNPHVLNTEVDQRLAQAALESVRQWRYQPTLLNGQPVETATTVTVEFRLGK